MLYLLINLVFAGTLWPVSIDLSIANRYEYADYTFTLIPDSTIPIDSEIQIIFPSQYLYGLGIDLVLDSTCSHVCTITGYLVRFYMENEVVSNQTLQLKINNIKNPETKGGTGNFIVRSKLGQNVFDENLIFGTVGIADYALDFNAIILSIDENSTNVVNQNALYNFYIKPPIDLPQDFYIQITSPLSSDLTNCSIIEYNHTTLDANITCAQGITISGFPKVAAQYTFGIQLNFKNPPYAQTTDTFRVVAFRKNTKMVYAWRSAVAGVVIAPSQFLNISLTPGSNKSAIVSDYTLKMKLANAVPATGNIVVQLPINFELAYGYDYVYVKSGITSDALNITYTLYQFTINNFKEIPQYSDIEIVFRVVNPQLAGQSSSFTVQTMYDSTHIIELCNTQLVVVVQDSVTYPPVVATLSVPYASSNTDIQFPITSTRNTATKMIIYFGSDWQYQTTAFTCKLDSTTASSCTLTTNTLTIQFPSVISGSRTISINGLLKAPMYGLDQFITYDTFDGSNVAVESGSVKIVVNPKLDSSAVFTWVGKGLSTSIVDLYATLQIKFTPTVLIPNQTIIEVDEGATDEGTTDEGATDEGATTPDESSTDEGTTPTTPTTPTIPTLTPPTPHGEIWIQFGPLLTWADDLGITTLFCLTDLLPMDNVDIGCQLYDGSDSTKPEIRILNFKEVAANTAINVKITGIKNPQLTPIELSIFSGIRQYSNRIAYDYATISIPLSTVVPLTEATVSSSFSTSTSSVNQLFNLVFQPTFSAGVPIGSVVRIQLPGYENGLLQSSTKCTVDSTDMPCDKYLKVDWLEIILTAAATTTSTITLSNLKWPSTSYSAGYVHWIVFTANLETDKAVVQGSGATQFPAPNANDFDSATITQYQSGRGYPGQIFRFEFSVNNNIKQGAIMRIQFPNEFALRASTPTPTCNGYDPDSIELNAITAKTVFEVVCVGIKTPSNPPDNESDGWSVYIYIDGRTLNQKQNFFSYYYTNVFSQGTIQILQLQAVPLNINEIATYTVVFQPENSLLINSQIHITFPSTNFEELPYPPNLADCDVEGGVNSFQSCLLDGSSFIIILNKIYESGTIQFSINNVQNPSDLLSDGFVIKTYYDNVLVDSTDESTLLNRTITYYDQPQILVINSLTFQPQNMGVKAIYQFNISTDSTVNGSIVLTFPNTYDQRLGDNIKVFVNDIKTTTTINNRILSLPESTYIAKYNSILIEIQNIINPNTAENSNTGQFRVGIRQSGRYTHYNGSVGVLEMLSPPGWLYLQNMQSANQYSRWQSQYIFDMVLYNDLPSNGYLQMDFPEDYEISDQTGTCSFNKCIYSNNVLKAYTDPVNGQLKLSVLVENPLNEVQINSFQMQSKDDRHVVEQSFPNLDPFSFKFTYSGPLIYINEDQDITIPQGSESPDLIFRVDYPMALNLTFKHTLTGDFVVTPKDITFSYTNLQTTFRVQIPSTLSVGIYYIYWGTFGEKSNPIYTPIKKSKVIVVSQTIQFYITALYPIPNGGNSLVMAVSTVNAPYDKTTVTISNNDKTFYFTSGEQSDTTIKLTFQLGVNKQEFRVQQNYTELIRQTQLDILNEDDRLIFYSVDNKLYTIPAQQTVKYIDATNVAPKLTKLSVGSITQYSATIDIEINQISEAFYMYCLNKTTPPVVSELLSLGPPLYITSLSKYGQLNILAKSSIDLQLYAQTDYAFYIVLRNQEGLLSNVFSLNFTTQNRSKIAQFTLQVPYGANQAQIVTLMNNLAFILSLPSYKIQQKITYSTTGSRLLASNSLQLYVVPFNNTANYPTPKDLISKITTDTQFKRLMKIYLPSISISGLTLAVAEIPKVSSSSLTKSYLYDCEIEVTLSAVGYVFAIASSSDESTPFQIFKGLNNINVKVPNANQHILTKQSFNISNLEPNKTYTIQIVAASDLPEYPDLSQEVTKVQCSTQILADRAPQIVTFGILLSVVILFIYQ